MKAKLITIGNSRGVRIPRPLIEEAGLSDEVELSIHNGAILIAPRHQTRAGWAEAAKRMHERGDDALIGESLGNIFDREEWTW